MLPNRAPAPSPVTPCKFTVVETCERIKEEFNFIQQQNHSLHIEREKLMSERTDMQRICVMYYEMANGLNLEMHRQMEIAKRLGAILTQVLPFLAPEHQSQVLSAIDRAKQVTMQELNSVLAAQIEEAKTSKFFNGGNPSVTAEQQEAYKMSMFPGAPFGSPNLQGHGVHSGQNAPSAASSGSFFGGLPPNSLQSLSPSNNPAMSAVLLNGLISGSSMPNSFVPTSSGLPSSLGREVEKFIQEDKHDRISSNNMTAGSSKHSGGGAQVKNSASPQLGSEGVSPYPTTSSAPAAGSLNSGSGRFSQVSDPPSSMRWKRSRNSSGSGSYSFFVLPNGQTKPCLMASAPGVTSAPGLPRRLQHITSLRHGDVVCSVTLGPCPVGRASSYATASDVLRGIGSDTESMTGSPNSTALSVASAHFAYTGARGSVKLWDLTSISAAAMSSSLSSREHAPLATFDCLLHDSYVRSIKLFPDSGSLIIGGESNALTLWDLHGPGRRKAELSFEAPACYALALSLDGKLCYSCCSDGGIAVWDVHNQSVVHQFHGHVDGTSCVELTGDGNRLWTGGLDHKVCCWDIRGKPTHDLYHIEFQSQVFSLGITSNRSAGSHSQESRHSTSMASPRSTDGDLSSTGGGGPTGDNSSPQSLVSVSGKSGAGWLAVGLESSEVEVVAIGPDGPALNTHLDDGGPMNSGNSSLSPVSHYGSSYAQHFRLTRHQSCVLALRFAHHGDWFLTTGKDHQVNAWRTPYGACLLETKEAASVLTCDISSDDKYVVTGSGDKRANLYEVVFSSQR